MDTKNKRKQSINGLNMGSVLYGKVAPSAKELEEVVLGAILLEKTALQQVTRILKPDHFYVDSHVKIYETMLQMDSKNLQIDILTVIEALRERGWLDQVGGPYYVTRLTNSVVSSAHIESHARIILQKWLKRQCIRISGELLSLSYEDGSEPMDVIDGAMAELGNLLMTLEGIRFVDYTDVLHERLKQILTNEGKQAPGVLSGFKSLDKILICFFPQLYIIAARPSMGKTAFLIALLQNITRGSNLYPPVPVGVIELETTAGAFVDRHLANETGIDSNLLKAGGLTHEQKEGVMAGAGRIVNQAPLLTSFKTQMDIVLIRALIRIWVEKYKVKIVFIDYLQIMSVSEQDERKPREQQVAKFATDLAALAKDVDIPIVALAQLSRTLLSRTEKRPELGDLRESGTIEAAARVVAFIHRPEVYGTTANEDGEELPAGTTEIIVRKNNDGATGTANLIMQPHLSRYIDATELGPQWQAIQTEAF